MTFHIRTTSQLNKPPTLLNTYPDAPVVLSKFSSVIQASLTLIGANSLQFNVVTAIRS